MVMRPKHLLCSQFTQNSPPLQIHLGNDPKGKERLQATNICFFLFLFFSGIANWFSNNSVLAFQEIKSLSPCQIPWCSYTHHGWNQVFSRKSPNMELGEVCTASFKSSPCVSLLGFRSHCSGMCRLAPDSQPTCSPSHTHWAQRCWPGTPPASTLPPPAEMMFWNPEQNTYFHALCSPVAGLRRPQALHFCLHPRATPKPVILMQTLWHLSVFAYV